MKIFDKRASRTAFSAMIPVAAALTVAGFARPAIANDIVFAPGTGIEASAEPESFAPAAGTAPTGQAEKLEKVAAQMADPAFQDGLSGMAEGLGKALLNLPIGKFANAIEKARPGTVRKTMRENATLADIAGKDAGQLPAQMAKQSRVALTAMSGLASAFASMMPALEKLGRDLEKSAKTIKTARR